MDPSYWNFWFWFQRNSDLIYSFELNQEAVFGSLKTQLDKIDPNLVFEIGPISKLGYRDFVVSADGITSSFFTVSELVNSAPNLDKWKIVAFRQRKEPQGEFYYQDISIQFGDIYFLVNEGQRKLDIKLYFLGFFESPEWTNLAFLLLDYVLGEYDTATYIGSVEKYDLTCEAKDNAVHISQLPEFMDRYKSKLMN